MLKRKISLLLCTVLIAGCFAQSAFADEIKTSTTHANQTTTEAKDTTSPKDEAEKTTDNDKKATEESTSTKESFPKVNFDIFTAKEAFDTDFHSFTYQRSLRDRCVKQQTKIEEFFSYATIITCKDAKFSSALDKVHQSKLAIFEDECNIESSKIYIKNYTDYKNNHKNLTKEALKVIDESINISTATIKNCEENKKADIATFNKALAEARSCETAENKNDLKNVLIAYIMQDYCGDDIKNNINCSENPFPSYKDIDKVLEDYNKPAAKTNVKPSAKKPAKTAAVTAVKKSTNKSLPKTGGFDAAPIASLSLIAAGAFLATLYKVRKH